MGRICPILNHALKDGVLVDDEVIVRFIQKSNIDFLPTELVCKNCKQEIIKLYNIKRKRARDLYKTCMRDGSVSSLKTSKTSSSTSSVYGGSEPIGDKDRGIVKNATTAVSNSEGILERYQNGIHNGHVSSSNTSIQEANGSGVHYLVQKNVTNGNSNISTVNNERISNNPAAKVISENGKSLNINKNPTPAAVSQYKRTLRDYLTVLSPHSNVTIRRPAITSFQNSLGKNKFTKHQTASTESDEDDNTRRLSQEPTTSKAANTNKRPLRVIIDSDDEDDQSLSLNAVNGTRSPHIQPIPPKRRTQSKNQKSLAQDIMDGYIKDITGG